MLIYCSGGPRHKPRSGSRGCTAICLISDLIDIVNVLKCMCNPNKIIHSFRSCRLISLFSV